MNAIEKYNNNQQKVITLNIQTFQCLVLAAQRSILLLGLLFEFIPGHTGLNIDSVSIHQMRLYAPSIVAITAATSNYSCPSHFYRDISIGCFYDTR